MVPPNFFTILISFKSTLVALLVSIIFKTASTAIGDKSSQLADTTLELNDVFTHSIKVSRFVMSTGIERFDFISFRQISKAFWKPISQIKYLQILCWGECLDPTSSRLLSTKHQPKQQLMLFHRRPPHLEP